MQNKQKNFGKIPPAFILLPVIVFALSMPGCAYLETMPVNMQTQTAPKAVEQPAAQPESPASLPAPIIQQYALDRLKQMSDKLTSAKEFTYHSNSAIELPAITGQFLTFFTDTEVSLQRPDKLHINVSGDVPNFQLYFAGSKVLAFDPQNKLYAVSGPLSTIDEMLDFVMTKVKMNFPAADFLYSNPYSVMTKNLTHAIVLGQSMVNGVPCEHFAYMEPAINWEIWIEKGKKTLPLRLAMTYKKAPNFPRFLVEFVDWNLNPNLKTDTFVFKIPTNSKQIEFGTYGIEQKTK
ncbi:DUF2092 domain-containing protein [Methylobacter sp. S3L5C]|uniref:DUF2092 domain-containing protein n=1 Tax=Methylobacter sp. S3L5C TaxID=2839024 RepID=UPI001FAD8486|nr:DUF2092 domain-containing protein [Methylobacter sp. S3L5C]UOA09357.1 DUF2092 domain-containing protein [Methylobacter sp. S3L5C]